MDSPGPGPDDVELPAGPPGEPAWMRVARYRRLRSALDTSIVEETPDAIRASRAAGVKTEDLARLWGVTPTWIYRTVPAREHS